MKPEWCFAVKDKMRTMKDHKVAVTLGNEQKKSSYIRMQTPELSCFRPSLACIFCDERFRPPKERQAKAKAKAKARTKIQKPQIRPSW